MMMAKYIKGQNRNQLVLFPTKIDEVIGYDNEVRVIDAFVDMMDLEKKGFKRAVPNKKGTNSFDPRDMLKLFLYGYKNKIRSSRKLEKLCETNIEVMWLMKNLKPDFRTISDFRKENAKVLKEVFKETKESVPVCFDKSNESTDLTESEKNELESLLKDFR